MSYVVLARKWRPQDFDQIVGQEHVATTLKNAIELDRVGHAYLFSGPRGVGKTTTARILAKALNCVTGPTPTPCNKCVSCKEITAGISLDCIEIDGASNRGIDEIRELRENVKFMPACGKFKIYIIDEVHMLTPEAFNALLKTLEEPPRHVKFIFATTRPHKLLPTILSRCQRFHFQRFPLELIVSKLERIAAQEKIDVTAEALFYIAKAAGGSMRDAESLLDQLSSGVKQGKLTLKEVISILGIVDWELITEITAAIKENDTAAALDIVERVFCSGKDIAQFIDELIEHFRNLMVARFTLKDKETGDQKLSKLIDLTQDHLAAVSRQSEGFSVEDTLYIIQVLSNTRQMLRNSPLIRVPLELAMVRLTQRQSLVSLAQILKRLSELEARIGNNSCSESPRSNQNPVLEAQIANEKSASEARNINQMSTPDQEYEEAPPQEISGVHKFWPQLLQRLKEVKISAATYLSAARPIKLEGRMLTVGFPKNSIFSKEALERNHNLVIIENLLKEILKRDIKICLTLVESEASVPLENKDERHEPIIDRALDLFEGRIVKE